MQARVSAIDELVETGVLETPCRSLGLAGESRLLEPEASGEIEERLADLKQRVGVGQAIKAD